MYNNEAFSDYQITDRTGEILYLHKVILMNKIETYKVQFLSNVGNQDRIQKVEVESLVPYKLMFEAIYKDEDLNLPEKMKVEDLKELMHILKMYFLDTLMVEVYIDIYQAKCEIENKVELYKFLYSWKDTVDYNEHYENEYNEEEDITYKDVLEKIGEEIKANPGIVNKKLLTIIPSDLLSPELYFSKCIQFDQLELINRIEIQEITSEILSLYYSDYEISLIKDLWTKVEKAYPLSLLKSMSKEWTAISDEEWGVLLWINIKVDDLIVKGCRIYQITEIRNSKDELCYNGYKQLQYKIKVKDTGRICENKNLWSTLYKVLNPKKR